MPTEYTGQNRDITIRLGDDFVIALESNPTTGYAWEAHFDGSMLRLVDREFSSYGPGVGAGGIERFRLKALIAGDTLLSLIYKRPWESSAAEDIVFRVHVND